jgi:hypothetical protein
MQAQGGMAIKCLAGVKINDGALESDLMPVRYYMWCYSNLRP